MFTFYSSLLLYTSSVFAGVFIILYLYFIRNFNFWKKLGIPYVKPLPFVGNLKDAALQKVDIGRNLKQIYDEHKSKPYVGFFSFDKPSLLINDPELIKTVMVKGGQYFVNRTQTANEDVEPISAKAIFALKDDKWRHTRQAMTPIFTTNKMKKMFYLIENCAKELTVHLDKLAADGEFNCHL
jgi:cytochrome P450